MKLRVGNLRTQLVGEDDEAARWLASYLTFEDKQAKFKAIAVRKKFGRAFQIPDSLRLYDTRHATFPSGYLALVLKAWRDKHPDRPVELEECRAIPALPDASADISWLRPYQHAAVADAIHHGRGILQLPTGAGKTEIIVALTRRIPVRWLLLTHKIDLVHQAAERYHLRTGLTAGTIGDGVWDDAGQFIIATFQTFARRLKAKDKRVRDLLRSIGGLMVDESHTLPADTFYRVAMSTPQAFYRFGLSGTPLQKGEIKSLYSIAALGPRIHKLMPQTLIDAGVLAKPVIRMVRCTQGVELDDEDAEEAVERLDTRSSATQWQRVYKDLVVESKDRNHIVLQCAKAALKPCLVFIKEVAHGRELEKALRWAGLRVEFTNGSKATPERRAAIRRLEHGDTDVLICSVIFQEGIDIPSLASVIIAAGGQSHVAAIQRVGRGMRSDGGKKQTFEVWDIDDSGQAWLRKHALARKRAYREQGYQVDLLDSVNDDPT